MSATATEVACPRCGGKTWDNRETKKNPKAPDYKCRDKSCDGVIWPPKGNKAPYASGGPLPYETEAEAAEYGPPVSTVKLPPVTVAKVKAIDAPDPTAKLRGLFELHDACLAHAIVQSKLLTAEDIGDTPEAISARVATLFIQATQRGLGQ